MFIAVWERTERDSSEDLGARGELARRTTFANRISIARMRADRHRRVKRVDYVREVDDEETVRVSWRAQEGGKFI